MHSGGISVEMMLLTEADMPIRQNEPICHQRYMGKTIKKHWFMLPRPLRRTKNTLD